MPRLNPSERIYLTAMSALGLGVTAVAFLRAANSKLVRKLNHECQRRPYQPPPRP